MFPYWKSCAPVTIVMRCQNAVPLWNKLCRSVDLQGRILYLFCCTCRSEAERSDSGSRQLTFTSWRHRMYSRNRQKRSDNEAKHKAPNFIALRLWEWQVHLNLVPFAASFRSASLCNSYPRQGIPTSKIYFGLACVVAAFVTDFKAFPTKINLRGKLGTCFPHKAHIKYFS